MKFSIIIPCYNTSDYIERCLKSVIKQTYQNWEIIIVNDGSTDNTENIIRGYSEKNSKIKTINQNNQGLSAARNRGTEEAEGDYILFLDSDDWYKDEKCLEYIAKKIFCNENIEIIVFRFQYAFEDGYYQEDNIHYFDTMENGLYTGEKYLYEVLSKTAIYQWYPWRYAFSREFWVKNQIRFRLRTFEDIDIIYEILLMAQKIGVLNEIIYNYQMGRKGSITQPTKQMMKDTINVCSNTINNVNNASIDKEIKKLLNSNFSYGYFGVLTDVNYLEKHARKEVLTLLREHHDLMNYTTRKQNIITKIMVRIFGLNAISRLLFIRKRYKERVLKFV